MLITIITPPCVLLGAVSRIILKGILLQSASRLAACTSLSICLSVSLSLAHPHAAVLSYSSLTFLSASNPPSLLSLYLQGSPPFRASIAAPRLTTHKSAAKQDESIAPLPRHPSKLPRLQLITTCLSQLNASFI